MCDSEVRPDLLQKNLGFSGVLTGVLQWHVKRELYLVGICGIPFGMGLVAMGPYCTEMFTLV